MKNMKTWSTVMFIGTLVVLTIVSLMAMVKAQTWAQSLANITTLVRYGGG